MFISGSPLFYTVSAESVRQPSVKERVLYLKQVVFVSQLGEGHPELD